MEVPGAFQEGTRKSLEDFRSLRGAFVFITLGGHNVLEFNPFIAYLQAFHVYFIGV